MSLSNSIENVFAHLLFQSVIIVGLLLQSILVAVYKLIVPYKYRCKSVKDQTVLITGSGSGLGRLMAKKLARIGAKLVLVDIDNKGNQQTANEIRSLGGLAYTFTCDLSNKDDIYRCADEIQKTVGNVDILINNAGIVTGKSFLESSDQAIEKTMAVNTMSHFWLTKKFLPSMLENNHGHIVTIASMAGLYGTPKLCDYSASKSAVIGFDYSLRVELLRLNKTGVKTTCVCPYYINTGMFKGCQSALLPIIEPEYASDKIVEAILTDQLLLMMPRSLYFFYLFRGLVPCEVEQYGITNLLKSHYTMDEFIGREK